MDSFFGSSPKKGFSRQVGIWVPIRQGSAWRYNYPGKVPKHKPASGCPSVADAAGHHGLVDLGLPRGLLISDT